MQGPWTPVDAPTIALNHFMARHGVTDRTVRRWVDEGMPGVEKHDDGSLWFNLVVSDPWVEKRRKVAA